MTAPRVLLYDIETAPIRGVAWRRHDTDLVWIDQDWHLLSFAWKWLGQKAVRSASLPDFAGYAEDPSDDRALACQLWSLFDQADVVIAHNGNKFDQKKARARFLSHGFMPPTPFREVDTLQVARRHFAFTSNRLDDLCRSLGIGGKVQTGGAGLWRGCLAGDERSWRLMNKYNRHDVRLLEELYERLLPWIDGHPNMALIGDKPDACPKCGSNDRPLKSKGWRHYGVTSKRVFRCLANGCVVYGRAVTKSTVQHVS